ncbi:MAG: hypothetical protein CFE24_08690 [Flavobacterium sp. BFFFF2]|nr:MAG: hypothetical protein CFE24_08690 [Flavobacterium sp. BFFFF2]
MPILHLEPLALDFLLTAKNGVGFAIETDQYGWVIRDVNRPYLPLLVVCSIDDLDYRLKVNIQHWKSNYPASEYFLIPTDDSVVNLPEWLHHEPIAEWIPQTMAQPLWLISRIERWFEQQNIKFLQSETQKKYQLVFEKSPSVKLIFDAKTTCLLEYNDAFCTLFGYQREALTHKRLLDILDLHERYRCANFLKSIEHEVKQTDFKSRALTQSGQIIDIQVEINQIQYNDNLAFIGIITDITQQIKSDKEKWLAEEQFKTLVKDGSELIVILDSSACFTYISPNIKQKFHTEVETLYGEYAFDLLHADDVDYLRQCFDRLKDIRRINTRPFRYFKHKKKWRWFEATLTDMRDNEAVSGFMISGRDVTNRIETEQEIIVKNQRYEAIVRSTHGMVYEFEFTTNNFFIAANKYLDFFNHRLFEKHIHLSQWLERIHPDDLETVKYSFLQLDDQSIDNEQEMEYRFLKNNGEYTLVSDRFVLLYEGGKLLKKIGTIQDITQKKLQETLLSLEKDIYKINTNAQLTLSQVLDRVIARIEHFMPESICSILELISGKMFPIAGSRMPVEFSNQIAGAIIGPKVGSCGTAMYTKSTVIVEDIYQSALWADYLGLVDPFGFKACWSVPIFKSDGTVFASFATYHLTTKKPNEFERQLLERMSSLIAVVIENRKAAEEVRKSKERYEMVSLATRDTIWDWNIQSDTIHWSKGLEEVFGYYKDITTTDSKWWFEKIHPEDSVAMSVNLYNFLNSKSDSWQHEYRFKCNDGTYKYILDRAFLVKDDKGEPARLIGTLQDISQQKSEEQRLKLLETVIVESKDAVVIAEADEALTSTPKIVFINASFSKMTGYQLEEVRGNHFGILFGPQSDKRELVRLTQALQIESDCEIQSICYRKSGERFWADLSIIPIKNNEGVLTHWISIQRDISEEKSKDIEKEQLIRELTQNNRDLKQFSYITSHNLRAPLSNLIGLLNLVDELEVHDEELRELIDGFSKSTHLLNETINDLVKVVIIKDNPYMLLEDVNFIETIDGIKEQLSYLFKLHETIFHVDIQEMWVPHVNKSYFESVILNLMTNAIKYREPSRTLEITIQVQKIESQLHITFGDNGIGIDLARNADKVFGLYQRFHNYSDSKGLGLYLVKSQIESMGGTISIDSKVDVGTTYTIIFPFT